MKKVLFATLSFILLISCNNKPTVKSGFAEVNGTSLYFEVAGKGKPLLFVHGNFGDHRHWDFQFAPLSKKYKVIRYDVRGFGKSAVPKSDELFSHRNDLKALLEFLDVEKAHICGLSMGSGIAVDFVIDYPEMCLSLIPIGPWAGGFGSGDFKSSNADSLFAVFPIVNEILKNHGPKEATDYLWKGNNCLSRSVRNPATLDALLIMGYEYSYWSHLNSSKIESLEPPAISRLKEIKLPTLIITAEYDLESCKEIAEIMEKEITGSVKISIKDAGHIMNMDKPDEFNRLISEFIDSVKQGNVKK